MNRLPWPLPALVCWALGWVLLVLARAAWGWPLAPAWLLGALPGLVAMPWGTTAVRRASLALGFPLSWWVLAAGQGGTWTALPPWVWLVLLGVGVLVYPPSAWRDAPLFPTPPGTLDGLGTVVRLPLAAHVLDAGCGLGDGLRALERAWPDVHLHGLERSWPLRLLCALRCPTTQVRQGDLWAHDWSRYQLVYLFQRPESMPRAWAKAQAELQPGAWLASLEFAVPDVPPTAVWTCPDGRPVWLYRPHEATGGPAAVSG